jgi:cholesterol transport system auxiliary component
MVCLTSCSLLSPVTVDVNNNYMIDNIPASIKHSSRRITGPLLVLPVEANVPYNTKQMIYSKKPYQIAYYVKHQWASTPANMLQPLIVASLQNSHRFKAVVTSPFNGRYQYTLMIKLIELQQDYSITPAKLRLILSANLINAASGQIMSQKTFAVAVNQEQASPYGGAQAANQASALILLQLVHWINTVV